MALKTVVVGKCISGIQWITVFWHISFWVIETRNIFFRKIKMSGSVTLILLYYSLLEKIYYSVF